MKSNELRLIVYGTFRKGESLEGYIPSTMGTMQTMAIPGLRMYVMGDFPAAKIGTKDDYIIAEVWEFKFKNEKFKEWYLSMLDQVEGVDKNLYERRYVNVPTSGKALIYICKMRINGSPKVHDWKNWQKLPEEVKQEKLAKGGVKGVIARIA